MLTVHQITKSYGLHPVLKNITFTLNRGERAGLVGPNGCGKTTLLRILIGEETADSGQVTFNQPGLHPGYLPQGFELPPTCLLSEALTLAESNPADVLEQVAAQLAAKPQDILLQARYDEALRQLSVLPGPEHTREILATLGLDALPGHQPVSTLSGGQKTRLSLARLLLQSPELLLLDEPTNHLDIHMLEWLEAWLQHYHGAVLVVSHDRMFLDHTVTQILELDPASHTLKQYAGNYSAYLEQKMSEQEKHAQQYADWQDEIASLKRAANHLRSLTRMKKGGKADSGDTFAKGFFGNRATKRVAGKAKNLEHRIETLMTDERVEKPAQAAWKMKLEFSNLTHVSRDVLVLEDLTVGYAQTGPLLTNISLYLRGGSRVVLTGENGSGKSTLLKTIIGQVAPLAGSIRLGSSVHLGYMSQEQETLELHQTVLQTIQQQASLPQTEARTFLHAFLFSGDDPLRPVGELSFGERARLQLAILVAQGCNFLLLDEPINHLDIPSRTRFEQALDQFNGTILAVVHDRYFIQQFANETWEVEGQKLIRNPL